MTHTEAQAQDLWCPFVRQAAVIKGPAGDPISLSSANRTHDGKLFGLCAASQCMAWRWDRSSSEAATAYARGGLGAGLKADPTPKRGFCGLAGSPRS